MQPPVPGHRAQRLEGVDDLAVEVARIREMRGDGDNGCHDLVEVVLVQTGVRVQRADEPSDPRRVVEVRMHAAMAEEQLLRAVEVHRRSSSARSLLAESTMKLGATWVIRSCVVERPPVWKG